MKDNQTELKTIKLHIPVIVKIFLFVLLLCLLCMAGYVIYMQANYYRIEDHASLEVEQNPNQTLKTGRQVYVLNILEKWEMFYSKILSQALD